MATATKKAHAATSTARAAHPAPGVGPFAFVTYRDNGDNYHWEIVDPGGNSLAHSGSFTSQGDADRAARHVREGVRSTDFEPHVVKRLPAVAV
jgi:hypothetical protein